MKLDGKRVDLVTLKAEADTAGVVVGDLGTVGLDAAGLPDELITWDEDGSQIDVPPTMQPVVAAHVPPPLVVEHVEERTVASVTTTTDATLREVYRVPCVVKHVYSGTLVMRAVDAGNGSVKVSRVDVTFKRGTTATVQQVGALVVVAAMEDAGTAAWAITAQAQGSDLVIGVRGAAGRSITWHLAGTLSVFAPEGLS